MPRQPRRRARGPRAATKNTFPKGFLRSHRTGRKDSRRLLPLNGRGFLRLEYAEDGALCLVSFVMSRKPGATAIGPRLELAIGREPVPESDAATLMEEAAVSGVQWRGGCARWGHTYDDGGPGKGRRVEFDDWVDESIAALVNPSREQMEEHEAREAETKARLDVSKIRAAIEAAAAENEPVWELPTEPYSSKGIVRALLDGLRSPAWRVRMSCAEALGLSSVEQPRIARALRGLVAEDPAEASWREAIQALGELGAFARPAVPAIVARLRRTRPPLDHLCVEALAKIPSKAPERTAFFERSIVALSKQTDGVDTPANVKHAVQALAQLERDGRSIDLARAFAPLARSDPGAGGDVLSVMEPAATVLLRQVSFEAAVEFLRPFVERMKKQHGEAWSYVCKDRLMKGFGRRAQAALDALSGE